jgi:hypothetical protein
VLLTSQATKDAPITKGQARIISLGGWFGTWQGLGWAGLGDGDGDAVVASGVVAGLAGMGLAISLSHAVHFSEGHAEITNSAMYWGAWYGLVESSITGRIDDTEDSPLIDMLVGSGAGVIIAGIGASGAQLTESRMRLISLSGILGAAIGGGLILLAESDEGSTNMFILGCGSAAGLGLGVYWTRNYDKKEDFAATQEGPAVEPVLAMRSSGKGHGTVPTAGLRIRF